MRINRIGRLLKLAMKRFRFRYKPKIERYFMFNQVKLEDFNYYHQILVEQHIDMDYLDLEGYYPDTYFAEEIASANIDARKSEDIVKPDELNQFDPTIYRGWYLDELHLHLYYFTQRGLDPELTLAGFLEDVSDLQIGFRGFRKKIYENKKIKATRKRCWAWYKSKYVKVYPFSWFRNFNPKKSFF